MKGRNFRFTREGITYDSLFEYKLLTETSLTLEDYHQCKLEYESLETRTYRPDCSKILFSGIPRLQKVLHFEAKGRFIDKDEPKKYLNIHNFLKERGDEFIFVFEKPEVEISFRQKRKDGSRITLEEWANNKDISWVTVPEVDHTIRDRCLRILRKSNLNMYYPGQHPNRFLLYSNHKVLNIYDKYTCTQAYHGEFEEFVEEYLTVDDFIRSIERGN